MPRIGVTQTMKAGRKAKELGKRLSPQRRTQASSQWSKMKNKMGK